MYVPSPRRHDPQVLANEGFTLIEGDEFPVGRDLDLVGVVSDPPKAWRRVPTWAGMPFPGDGEYAVPGALVPVQFTDGRGLDVEPNLWMRHPVQSAE